MYIHMYIYIYIYTYVHTYMRVRTTGPCTGGWERRVKFSRMEQWVSSRYVVWCHKVSVKKHSSGEEYMYVCVYVYIYIYTHV